jgi:hypothetical protein
LLAFLFSAAAPLGIIDAAINAAPKVSNANLRICLSSSKNGVGAASVLRIST